METAILWFGFVGAWFLVAGPVHQAAVELHDQEIDRERIAAASADVPRPDPVSAWWWLLPPVKYWLERQESRRYRDAVFEALGPAERAGYVDYMNKATGWLFVAIGGFCIAAKETWELLEHYHRPVWLWLLVVIGMVLLCTAQAAARVGRSDEMKGATPRGRGDRKTRRTPSADRG